MLKNKKSTALVFGIAAMAMVAVTGCTKNATLVVKTAPEITRTISFATDIVPIFGTSCSITGCHNSGGKAPDLTASKAFASLTNGNYINTATPASSELYLWLTGKRSTAMPAGATNDPSSINELVLAWIKQGAQNN